MVVYTLTRLWSTYRRCRFWQKKKKIISSDEVHFDLGGYVNHQNSCIWGTENPHAYIQKPTHPKRVIVWCEFWSKGIIGKFFFENKQGEAITVNGAVIGPCWTNFCTQKWNGTFGLNKTALRVPHSRSYTRCFALCFWRSHYQPQSWCRLATNYYSWTY